MDDIEIQKLLLEEKRMEKEYQIKTAELALKHEELSAKIKSDEMLRKSKGLSPVVATILVAIFGLAGTGLGATLQGVFSIKLERQKFESTLISKAIEPEDASQRAQRLKFYTEIGLITDKGIILGLAKFIENPATIPHVSAPILTREKINRLRLARKEYTDASIIGEISANNKFLMFTLEKRASAIPIGVYQVSYGDSPRFGRPMPIIENVPKHDSPVYIQSGNTVADVDNGSIAVGQEKNNDSIRQSRLAFDELSEIFKDNKNEKIVLEIVEYKEAN